MTKQKKFDQQVTRVNIQKIKEKMQKSRPNTGQPINFWPSLKLILLIICVVHTTSSTVVDFSYAKERPWPSQILNCPSGFSSNFSYEPEIPQIETTRQVKSNSSSPSSDFSQKKTSRNRSLPSNKTGTILELVHLIQQGISASEKTLGKNVVVALSKTGAGKSTTTHYVAGIKIIDIAQKPSKRGLAHIANPQPVQTLPGFSVGSGKSSETKLVNVLETEHFPFVDTCGLSDTQGFNYDLANTISLERVFHNAESVRILFLLKQSSIEGDQRGATLIKLITEVVGYAKNIEIQDFIPSVTILITHVVYRASEITESLRQILQAETKAPTVKDEFEREKVLKFLQAMILGSELDASREEVKDLKQIIAELQSQIEQVGLFAVQEKIQKYTQKIKTTKNRINRNKASGDFTQQIQEWQTDLEEYETQLINLTQQRKKKQSELQKLNQDIERKQKQLSRKEKEITLAQNQYKMDKQRKTKCLFNQFISFPVEKLLSDQERQKLIKVLKYSPRIQNPKKHFQMSIRNQLEVGTQNMAYEILQELKKDLKQFDYDAAEQRLRNILFLSEYITTKKFQTYKETCIQLVKDSLQENCNFFRRTLSDSLAQNGILTEKGMDTLTQTMKRVEHASSLTEKLSGFDKERNSLNGLYGFFIEAFRSYGSQALKDLSMTDKIFTSGNTFQKLKRLAIRFQGQIPSLLSMYQVLGLEVIDLIESRMKKTRENMKNYSHSSLSVDLKFLSSYKEMMASVFKEDISIEYKRIVNESTESLRYRYTTKFDQLIENLTIDQVEQISYEYQNISFHLNHDKQLHEYIAKQVLEECINRMTQLLVNQSLGQIQKMKESIKNNKFQDLEGHMNLLKAIRDIDNAIASKTYDSYVIFLSSLLTDLTGRSETIIKDVMAKVRLGTVTIIDIDNIKKVLDKLQKMDWLGTLIGTEGLTQLLDDTTSDLVRHAEEITFNINTTFQRELELCEKYRLKEHQLFYAEFDKENQTLLNQMQFQNYQKRPKFLKVNSALGFVEKLSQINQKLQQIHQKSKELVLNLVKKQLESVLNSIHQHNQTFQLHKANLNRHIIRVSSMKQINIGVSKEIEDSLNYIFTRIVQYFEKCSNALKSKMLSDSKTFASTVNTYMMLIKSLRSCDTFLRKQGIDINLQKDTMLQYIKNRFFEFYEAIDEQIKNQKINETKQSLSVLKSYRNTIVDRIIKDQISKKYSDYSGIFNGMVSKIPEQILKLLNNGQFSELLIVFEDLCSNKGNERACRNVQSEIDSKIPREYKQILEDLAELSQEGNHETQYKSINNQIKDFNRYHELISIIPHLDYPSKKQHLISELKSLYETMINQMKENIGQFKFKGLKIKIDKIIKFHKVLLKGILEEEYSIEKFDARKKLEEKVNEIINYQIGNQWSKYFNFLDKLKQIDQQFQTYHGSFYQTKIKNHLFQILKHIKNEAQSANNTQILYTYKQTTTNLKNETNSFIIENIFFSDLQEQFKNTQNMIDQLIQIIGGCSNFDEQCLQWLKENNFDKYSKVVIALKKSYENYNFSIQQTLKIKNYQNLTSILGEITKFDKIKKHLRLTTQTMPLAIKEKTIKKIQVRAKSLKNQLQKIVRHDPVSNSAINTGSFNAIEQYLSIFQNINFDQKDDDRIIYGFNQFHRDVSQRISDIIPKVNENSTIKVYEQRLRSVKAYSSFIGLFKKYIDRVQSSSTETVHHLLSQYPAFVKVFGQVYDEDKLKEKNQQILSNLPDHITNLWKSQNFKKILSILLDLKSMNSKDSNDVFEKLISQVQKFIEQAGDSILRDFKDLNFQEVNEQISSLKNAENEFKSIKGLVQTPSTHQKVIQEIDNGIKKQIVEKAIQKINQKEPGTVAEDIIDLKKWVIKIPLLNQIIQSHIQKILREAKAKKVIYKIASRLDQKSEDRQNPQVARISSEILSSHASQLNIPRVLPKPTKKIEDLIPDMKGDIQKQQLLNIFKIYQKQFDELIKQYVSSSDRESIPNNLNSIKIQIFKSLKQIQNSKRIKDEKSRLQIPKLLARIFAYMSIMKTGASYYEAVQNKFLNEDTFLFQPHTIQVLSILRFLGCDKKDNWIQGWFGTLGQKIVGANKLQNHFMQIKTGQGKSIILGAMSTFFSLMGHEVYSVCYSASLSQRDYKYFKDVFEAFNVSDRVKYGTFSEISEMIINQKGDVRTLVQNLYLKDKKSISKSKNAKQTYKMKILLVDEVDNFFSKQFYGNTYNPCTFINSPNVIEIIKFVWAHKEHNVEHIKSLMRQTTHYKELSKQFTDCFSKIQRQLYQMVDGVKKYKSRDYVIQNDRIGYKELDGISFNTVYGYETMFSYMYQHDSGRISQSKVKANLGIILSCGKFSYAEMIDSFDMIFGVTGTLEDLTSFEEDILKRYNITTRTYAPSVYGDSRLSEKRIQIIEGQNNHNARLKQIITERINNGQAVLVFFQNQTTLLKYSSSGYAEGFKGRMNILTEKTQSRDHFIRMATSSQFVTLFTASFGRGTDFVVHDPITKDKGVFVIQTFLSEQLSEQKQIKGRTARQGSIGEYQMVLNYEQINSKFGITHGMINKTHSNFQLETLFTQRRKEYKLKQDAERIKTVQLSKITHKVSLEMMDKILSLKATRNDQFFFKTGLNTGKTRIAIAIDSTGSMGDTIQAVKGKVMDMIQRLAKTYPNMFQIQILFYYGYNAYTMHSDSSSWGYTNRLHVSPWSDDVNVLNNFLKTASANGGSVHEAIEVALHHFIKLNDQVGMTKAILIGDSGRYGKLDSSMIYQVHPSQAHRYKASEIEKPMVLVLQALIKELRNRQVKVDTYPIENHQDIQVTCKQISDMTGGKVTHFDPKKDDLAAEIEETIMQAIKMRK